MRNRLMHTTAALVLASASLVLAQQPPADKPAEDTPSSGSVSIGFQGSSVSGDRARFERYRDLRNRQNIQFDFAKNTDKYVFDVVASNAGNRDGYYGVTYANRKVKFRFSFDSVPLNYGYNTSTPWTFATMGANPSLALDAATRLAVQNKQAGVLGIPTTYAQWTTQRSSFLPLASPFDLQSRRDVLNLAIGYAITEALEAEFSFKSTKRDGYQPFGAAFAFVNANEIPLPINDRTNEFEAGIDWANPKGMFRVAYEHSAYANSYQSLTWDNPIRATDWAGSKTTLWDPSGYNNGNGAAQGRMSMWPDNTLNSVLVTGLYKPAPLTSLSANLAMISMANNSTPLIPWSTNAVVNNSRLCSTTLTSTGYIDCTPSTVRQTAEGKVDVLNASLVFNTRPMKNVNLTARYRHNNHENKTPLFDYTYNVRFDAVPEFNPGETSEPYTITQDKVDVDAAFNVIPYSTLKVGYTFDSNRKSYLAYHTLTDNGVRVSLDTIGYQWLTLRALYEHTKRTGSDFHQEAITDAGGQPNSRAFDDAERTRNRMTFIATLTPAPIVDLTFSAAYAKDNYDVSGLLPQFGLLNNKNDSYNVDVNVNPAATVAFGFTYGRETTNGFQVSHNANPAGTDYGSWTDPNRDWNLTQDEKVNVAGLYLNLDKTLPKTNLRLAYDLMDSNAARLYGGPRIQELQTNTALTAGDGKPCSPATLSSCFEAFPDVTTKWQRLTLDARYDLTRHLALGVSYWFEKFDTVDFATVDTNGPVGFYPATGVPRIDYLGSISTGYAVRPYTGHTGIVRVIYMF